MIDVSSAFKERMKESRDFRLFAEVKFADGTETMLDGSQFTASGCSISDGADVTSFPLGEAAEKVAQIEIINDAEQYAGRDFLGAEIRLYIEFETGNGIERIEKGTYTVISPETYGETVIITACDDMYKADRDYTTALRFPQTAAAVLRDICGTCGISLGTPSFLHDNFMIRQKPAGSFREVIGQIALIACGNARIDRRNRLEIKTYDFSGWEKDEGVGYHLLDEFTAPKIGYGDTAVTGFKAVISGDAQEDAREIVVGTDAYCVTVDDPLIAGQEETVLSWLMERIGNVKFRTFSGDAISNPLVEFMDLAKVRDRRGKTYCTFVTDVDFRIPGYTVLKNSTPAMSRSALAYPSAASRVEQRARQLVESERTARELAVERLSEALTDASGLYATEEAQPDGSVVRYLHDKPGRAESKTIIKLTGEGIGISADGGGTFPWGITFTGEAILDLIYAVGINCDYLNTGAITVKDDGGSIIFSVDIDTGKVVISGDSVQIGGRSATEAIASAAETANTALDEARKSANLTIVLGNEYEGIPTDHAGAYTPPLSASTTVSVYYGHADVSATCKYSCVTSAGVTGNWNGASRTYTVTALSTDTGWVDITADYMSLFSVTKRFSVAKIKGGAPGAKGDGGEQGTQGINLLPDSDRSSLTKSTAPYSRYFSSAENADQIECTFVTLTDPPVSGLKYGVQTTVKEKISVVRMLCWYSGGVIPMENGETYTLSCYAREISGNAKFGFSYGYTTYNDSSVFTPTSEWKRYAWSFVYDASVSPENVNGARVYLGGGGSGIGVVQTCGFKLEKGAPKKTEWTPAPQDLKGDSGKGISSITNHYLATASGSGVTASTSGWTETVQAISATKKYLWNYETVNYTDNSTSSTSPHIIGVYGDTGAKGTTGAAGKGISSITEYYVATTSGTSAPADSAFSTTVPTLTATNKYLWNYEKVTYTDGTVSNTEKCVIGVYGDKGATGAKGDKGDKGATGDKGAKGDTGAAGRTYFIELTADVLKRGANNAVTPAALTASAYYRDGSSASRTSYAGRWIVATSTNGTSFTNVYTSSANEASHAQSVGSLAANIVAVRFTLYAAGGTTQALDMQTVPVVVDVASLSHEQIFNLLTDNGKMQGIYQEGGNLYVNGAYIKAGTVSADKLASSVVEVLSPSQGITALWNENAYSGGSTPDGEALIISYDPLTGATADKGGWVMWRGTKRDLPKIYVNPNQMCPYNTTIYIVARLSSSSATSSSAVTPYLVWYNGDWKSSNTDATKSTSVSAWTWAESTDIVIGSFVEPASEAPFVDCELYNPCLSSRQLTKGATAYKNIADWCYNNNLTYINGGKIYTGTVTANAIAANAITSAKIAADAVTAEKISVSDLSALNATIGGFHIVNASNAGTSANGGHRYTNSLYRHSSDGTYEYEVGIKGDASESASATTGSTNLAFYVKRIAKGGKWDGTSETTPFAVAHNGALSATSATITGKITATSGYIGGTTGWTIKSNAIYNGTSSISSTTAGTYIGTDGIRNYSSASKYVNIKGGVLTAAGADISGKITASSGTIGGWKISDHRLYNDERAGYAPVISCEGLGYIASARIATNQLEGMEGASSYIGTAYYPFDAVHAYDIYAYEHIYVGGNEISADKLCACETGTVTPKANGSVTVTFGSAPVCVIVDETGNMTDATGMGARLIMPGVTRYIVYGTTNYLRASLSGSTLTVTMGAGISGVNPKLSYAAFL